ncbi:MAG: hypothetical protein HRU75_04965 [Planctomycetia bacterium]|nr:MAG: hypothetical protein HRU75_04965 [Planctomycetia bacterium]
MAIITHLMEDLLQLSPIANWRHVFAAKTIGALPNHVLRRISEELSAQRVPFPESMQCDDVEWAVYVEKLAWWISSARKESNTSASIGSIAPPDECYVNLIAGCLYLHAVSVARQWSPDFEEDAIELIAESTMALNASTITKVVLVLLELYAFRSATGWTVPRCLHYAVMMLVPAASALASNILDDALPGTRNGSTNDKWRDRFLEAIEVSAAELEIKLRTTHNREGGANRGAQAP